MSCHFISIRCPRFSCLGGPGRPQFVDINKDIAMILRSFAVLSYLAAFLGSALAQGKGGEYRSGVVVSVSAAGSDAGLAILKKGGNAVDAAVGTAFALAVTWPAAGNIGGGGFMLVFPPGDKPEPVVIDYRETAPAAVTKDTFKDEKSWYNHRVVGVPGTVRGLALSHAKYGKLAWKDLVEPAIKLAEDGFDIDEALAKSLNNYLEDA